ncbi:MAG TPA: tetratricopeptide repeat protein [Gammaproteobacteria bacterium]|nr:tetratricopeptide repeat protein [Gammaproteobacteria bacterium]
MNNIELSAKKNEALVLIKNGDLVTARDRLEALVAVAPNNDEFWFYLGSVYGMLNELDSAAESFRRGLDISPGQCALYYNLAVTERKQGDWMAALRDCDESLRLNQNYAVAHHLRGEILREMHRYSEAEMSCRAAIDIDPAFAKAHTNLGHVLRKQERLEEAAASYKMALSLDPGDQKTRYMLAVVGGLDQPDTPPPEYVQGLFDDFAERFDHTLVNKLEYRIPQLIKAQVVLMLEGKGGRMLDLGCGTGLCGEQLSDDVDKIIGIDLSPGMLEQARAREVYDQLLFTDIVEGMKQLSVHFDLIVAADVFIYVGDLLRVFEQCADKITNGGLFVFSVESAAQDEQDFVLRPSGRYAHSLAYIRGLVNRYGFREEVCKEVVIRKESGRDLPGYLIVLRGSYEAK